MSKNFASGLWEGKIDNMRGFFPKNFVKELKVFVVDADLVISQVKYVTDKSLSVKLTNLFQCIQLKSAFQSADADPKTGM